MVKGTGIQFTYKKILQDIAIAYLQNSWEHV